MINFLSIFQSGFFSFQTLWVKCVSLSPCVIQRPIWDGFFRALQKHEVFSQNFSLKIELTSVPHIPALVSSATIELISSQTIWAIERLHLMLLSLIMNALLFTFVRIPKCHSPHIAGWGLHWERHPMYYMRSYRFCHSSKLDSVDQMHLPPGIQIVGTRISCLRVAYYPMDSINCSLDHGMVKISSSFKSIQSSIEQMLTLWSKLCIAIYLSTKEVIKAVLCVHLRRGVTSENELLKLISDYFSAENHHPPKRGDGDSSSRLTRNHGFRLLILM
jgi:hypothetical protein